MNVNIGCREYGYRSIASEPILTPAFSVEPAGKVLLSSAIAGCALIVIALAPEIDIRPLEDFSIYWSMIKALFWISLPVCGYWWVQGNLNKNKGLCV